MNKNRRTGVGLPAAPAIPGRDEEIGLYQQLYRGDGYGMGQRRQASVQSILRQLLPRGTLLDVSTGRGETLRFAAELGFEPSGTEVVHDLCGPRDHSGQTIMVEWAQAHRLPFEDGAFDHVTCFDVLEHLVEEDVQACLAEMRRVARISVTASASERPSHFGGGRDLHISKRPAAQWEALMADIWGGATRIENAGGSPCWQWRLG